MESVENVESVENSENQQRVKKDYLWRCANIPGYRESIAAAAAQNYRKRKSEDPDGYNQKKSSYWRERYHTNPEFRDRVLTSLRARRAKAREQKQRMREQGKNPLKEI